MKAEKMIQPQQHGAGSEKKHSAATEATHPVDESNNGLTPSDTGAWRYMIERAAYFRAESRGFAGGCPKQDWYEAEAEIDRMLSRADEASADRGDKTGSGTL